jgi:hypothetical protein
MGDATRFAVYSSHSWRPRDVDLNLQVWEQLAGACELLVDMPDEPGANPPYYINRIEELFRRTDFFVSVLTSSRQGSHEAHEGHEGSVAPRAAVFGGQSTDPARRIKATREGLFVIFVLFVVERSGSVEAAGRRMSISLLSR